MSPLVFVALVVAGGIGAAARYVVDLTVGRVAGSRFPWGILVVNATGSFALGLVVGAATHVAADAGAAWVAVAGTGFLGGYTTFSGVAVTSVLLAEERRSLSAVANAVGTFVVAVAAAWAGLVLSG